MKKTSEQNPGYISCIDDVARLHSFIDEAVANGAKGGLVIMTWDGGSPFCWEAQLGGSVQAPILLFAMEAAKDIVMDDYDTSLKGEDYDHTAEG